MPIEYRIIEYNTKALPELWKDNWILSCINENKMFFYREVKRVVSKKEITEKDDFTAFWNLYPKERRKKKKEAQDFWNKLDEKRRTLALEWLKKYLVYWKKTNQDYNFISMPLYWLKGERYMDEWLDDTLKNPVNEKLRTDLEEEKKLEEDRLWNEQALARLKASWKWEEYYNKALEETPEWQRKYERIIIARIISRLRTNL